MSRELYDLCRRYKYFYNKNKDVESWNKKYHDIDLSDAVAITKLQVGLVEHDLLKQLFKDMKVIPMNLETSRDIPMMDSFNGRIPYERFVDTTSTIEIKDSMRFIHVLEEYLCEFRSHNVFGRE